MAEIFIFKPFYKPKEFIILHSVCYHMVFFFHSSRSLFISFILFALVFVVSITSKKLTRSRERYNAPAIEDFFNSGMLHGDDNTSLGTRKLILNHFDH